MKPLVLMSPENPEGWKLEELFDQLCVEILAKCAKIQGDKRMEARAVLQNNYAIIGGLREAARRQRDSMEVLATIGPNQGPTGTPRIGVGSDPEPVPAEWDPQP